VAKKSIIPFPVAAQPAAAPDDGLTTQLLAAYGTNEARQRTCRLIGRGVTKRLDTPLAVSIKTITCRWFDDDGCTALVEIERGGACCVSVSWLLATASALEGDPEPFECVELGDDDAPLLAHAMTRMKSVGA